MPPQVRALTALPEDQLDSVSEMAREEERERIRGDQCSYL